MSSAALLIVEQLAQYLESGEHPSVACSYLALTLCARRLTICEELAATAVRSRCGVAGPGNRVLPCCV